ncbi:FAD-dependent oxidoreductase [Streptomyces purpureus]|uniref:FAD-dependent oxidoreductase n=1 Tax=Streptomyces purpureus TaxID=1951 RepID=UPI0003607D38|nr:FAD-dependent oxidoreductase [Streptomyces purpureus]
MKTIVVGGGLAAHRFVARLAELGLPGPVTVMGAEPHGAYQRTLLGSVLDGTLPPQALTLPGPPDGVRVRTGVTVHAVDRARRLVYATTPAGRTVKRYDTLVLATGARTPFPAGVCGGDVRAVRTLADCARPLAARVVVVGGGVLGVETASALRRRGRAVTLVHAGPYPLSGRVDEVAGALVAGWLERLGVELRLGTRWAGPAGAEETILLCTGAVPETALARAAGLTVRTGVVVDSRLRTDDPRIHAIGACAEPEGGASGLLDDVRAQAETLAAVLTGGSGRLAPPPPLVRPRTPGLELAWLGGPEESAEEAEEAVPHEVVTEEVVTEEVVTLSDPARGRYARLSLRGERVRAGVLVGLPEAVAAVAQAYDQDRPLPTDRLALLLGDKGRAAETDPAAWGDDDVVCHCNTVTKQQVAGAVRGGADGVGPIAAATRATTGCGGCADDIRALCAALRETPSDTRATEVVA